jgi:hypothetical protein
VTAPKEQAAMDYFNTLAERCQWCGLKRLGVTDTTFPVGHYLRMCGACRERLTAKRLINPQ